MSVSGHRWPAPVRAIAEAAESAVAAVRDRDAAQFEAAAVRLAALNPEQVGLVLGAVVRMLLEELHPDGLDGSDIQAVLQRCVRSAVPWFPAVEPDVLVVLLTGALGVHQPEEATPPRGELDLARHAPLLVADLLGVAGRPLAGYLDIALGEIARSEIMELP